MQHDPGLLVAGSGRRKTRGVAYGAGSRTRVTTNAEQIQAPTDSLLRERSDEEGTCGISHRRGARQLVQLEATAVTLHVPVFPCIASDSACLSEPSGHAA